MSRIAKQRWTGRMGTGLLAIMLAIGGAWALTGSPFEGADGDLTAAGGIDWDTFAAVGEIRVGTDLPSGQEDDSFRGKEDDMHPDVVFGSIPSNKSDLTRFYVIYDHREDGPTPRDLLYLSWFRTNTLGSANMDFEFNQSKAVSANGVTPVRTAGDVLVMFGFSGGGTQATLGMSRWTETGACEAASRPPCWGPVTPLSGIAEGAVNDVEVLDPVTGETAAAYTFGEAAIDMTAAGIFDTEGCTSFGSAFVKSRSSDSFTASMKDFIRPIAIAISNCAVMSIRKDAVPDSDEMFEFTAGAPLEPASFSLQDNGDDADGARDSLTFADRTGGAFTVSEQARTGWDLTAITCEGDATPVRDGEGRLTGTVDIRAGIGDSVECVFTNTRRGRILVDQVTRPAGADQVFAYGLSGAGVDQSFALADAAPAHDSGELRPGAYAVTPAPAPEGWDLTGAVCSDGSLPGAVDLDPAETVVCTFTHTQRGAIVMDVVTDPSGDPQLFPFDLSGGPSALSESFSLADADAPHVVSHILPGGGYALTGTLPEGWLAGPVACSDGSEATGIDVSPGEVVSCVLTATKMGRILVDKITEPAGDARQFDFTLTGGPDGISSSFQVADAAPAHDSGWLAPGPGFALEEIILLGKFARPEWDITGLSCLSERGESAATFTGMNADPAFQPGDMIATIDLAAGDTVRCAFTNTRRGGITVVKDAVPDASTDFSFTLTGGGVLETFALDDDGDDTDAAQQGKLPRRLDVTELVEGVYTVVQADPGAEWDATLIECRDDEGRQVGSADLATRTATVDLAPAEHITCLFTDTRRGAIVVEKLVAQDAAPGAAYDPHQVPFEFSSSFAGAFQLRHGESLQSELLPAGGGHAVSEQKPAGWEVTSSCVYPDGSTGPAGSISVPAGGVVVCTFVNEMVLHPGSKGFWRNWSNRYDEELFRRLLAEALAGSPVYADLFDGSGALIEDAAALLDAIFDFTGATGDQLLTAELTALKLNLAVSTSDDPEIRAMQGNDDICEDCLLVLDEFPGAEELLRDLSGAIRVGGFTVGDLVAVAESLWLGELGAGFHLYDLEHDSDVTLLASLLEETNQGRTLLADPASYPDNPTCVKQPGLPDGTEGMLYEAALDVTGGLPPYTCLLFDGELPPGLFLDASTCVIAGTPGPVGYVSKTFTFTLRIFDSGSGQPAGDVTLTITIHPQPVITTMAVPDAVMEMPYSAELDATGGADPRTWTLVEGALPEGLALDPATGRISGTPPALKPAKTVLATFTVQLSDGMGAADFATYTMALLPSEEDFCSPAPTPPTSLLLLGTWPAGADLYLAWTVAGDASGYDVVGGRLSALRAAGGFAGGTDACLASGHTSTGMMVAGTPAAGDAFWFLVRPMNCGGSGSWDSGGESQTTPRDAALSASASGCP